MTTTDAPVAAPQPQYLAIVPPDERTLAPGSPVIRNIADIEIVANLILDGGLAPKSYYEGNPDQRTSRAMVAIMTGARLGFDPFASLCSIAVVNGMPKVWGNGAWALAIRHPDLQEFEEYMLLDGKRIEAAPVGAKGDIPESFGYRVMLKRKSHKNPVAVVFTWGEALRAGLASKDTYRQHPAQMLKRRARLRAIEDAFADVLFGFGVEYQEDVEIREGEYTVRDASPVTPSDTDAAPTFGFDKAAKGEEKTA